jgi:proline racemase
MMNFDWKPPESWTRITAVDAHTAGEPLRIFTGGLPPIPGQTILVKRAYAKKNLDHLRRATMWEPRGHADMYGVILTEPVTPDGHVGVLFLHNEGFSTMCGHGIIGLTKVGLETGLLRQDQMTMLTDSTAEVRIDTPAGRVTARAIRNQSGNIDHISWRVASCELSILPYASSQPLISSHLSPARRSHFE